MLYLNVHFVLSSDEDDTAELLMELQKIRKERLEDQERKASEQGNYWKYILEYCTSHKIVCQGI